jgi:hypothetical protein
VITHNGTQKKELGNAANTIFTQDHGGMYTEIEEVDALCNEHEVKA